MSDSTFRERWVDEVFRTPHVTDSVRVALLALAGDMDDEGAVTARRDRLAERLGRSDRRVGDRLKAGIDSGYLERVARGQKNGDGKYRATIPGRPTWGHPGVPKKPGLLRTPEGPEEKSLQDDPQVEETGSLEDTRVSQRENPLRTPGGPEEIRPPYKARAHAHFNGDRSTDNLDESEHAAATNVVALFEKSAPSLRSKNTPARERAGELEADDALFDAFWTAYPRKIGKPSGRKAWAKAMKRHADPQTVILAARRYATDPRRTTSDIKYTPHPATWLNDERYLDEPEALSTAPAVDHRQQATNDMFERAMQRAIAREEGAP